jgi:PAS domain S-box-containing protein
VLGKWSDQNQLVIQHLQQINHNLQQQLQKTNLQLSQNNMTIANIIAQHQQAERTQRETENQFHSLTDMMIEATFIYQDENLLHVNPAAITLTNYSNPEELLTTNFWDIIHPDSQFLRSQSHSPPPSQNQITPRTEIKILTQSGQVKWLEFTAHPIDYQGETAMLGLALDITARKQTEETLCRLIQGLSTNPQEKIFQSLVKYLANLLQVDFAFIGRLKPGNPKQIETLAVFAHQQHVDNFEYSLSNTPCEIVINNQRFHAYSNRIQKQFPLDILLVEIGVESYFGVALCDTNNQVIGILSVMDSKPIANFSLIKSVLQIISIRAAVELEQLLHTPPK